MELQNRVAWLLIATTTVVLFGVMISGEPEGGREGGMEGGTDGGRDGCEGSDG